MRLASHFALFIFLFFIRKVILASESNFSKPLAAAYGRTALFTSKTSNIFDLFNGSYYMV